jgi:O-acetyl-ADP-ribose deacetylase (regulator of RNase III)
MHRQGESGKTRTPASARIIDGECSGVNAAVWPLDYRRRDMTDASPGPTIEIVHGDITTQVVDAIANAANEALRGGGGVDGAIHAAAGPGLLEELRRRYPDGTPTGTAVATDAHRLPARWILHAVGPVWRGGSAGEPELLASAYRSCLRLADELGARSVAFPAISMGIYGYPADDGARVALRAMRETPTSVSLVRFVLRGGAIQEAFAAALEES